jgi:DNA-binding NtrC family response regulator
MFMLVTESRRISVLLADPDQSLTELVAAYLRGKGHGVTCVSDGRQAVQAARNAPFDVAIVAMGLPGLDAAEVLRQTRADPAAPEMIVTTDHATVDVAITAMKSGAYDYLPKPFRLVELEVLVKRAAEKRKLTRQNETLRARLAHMDAAPEIVTQYAPMRALLALLERASAGESPVLIAGEPGTGKQLLARTVHRLSGREGPLLHLSADAVGENAADDALFGHERGAFATATARHQGLFELAAGGTLALRDVQMLGARLQAKLVRTLEQRTFFRLAGTQQVPMDVRLVTMTSADLDALAAEGAFRRDLLRLLDPVRVQLPPLRERAVDIPLLADHFVTRDAGPNGGRLTPDAVAALQEYSWPGNVRELSAVIERAVLLAGGGPIDVRHLALTGAASSPRPVGWRRGAPGTLADLERQHIAAVLADTDWHQGNAAQILGISDKTLYRKIREYGFVRPVRAAGR